MNESPRSLLWPAVFIFGALVFLLGLSAWQWRRLEWKEALIARIETRAHAEPGALPPRRDWPLLRSDDYEYRRVRASGRFDLAREALVFSKPPSAGLEPGYLVLTPFFLDGGGVVLVDRGFIAFSKAGTDARRREPAGQMTISGLLRAPQPRNVFTPDDNPEGGVWYTSDPPKIAAFLQLPEAAPFSIDLDPSAGIQSAADGAPRPYAGDLEVSNNHLAYALTWLALALALAGGFFVYARGRLTGQ